MNKHTPGPWELHNGYLIRKVHGDDATPIAEMRAPYRKRVGLVRGHYEQEANARLIAQAPELLEERDALRAEVRRLKRESETKDAALRWAESAFVSLKNAGIVGGSPTADAEFERNLRPIRAALSRTPPPPTKRKTRRKA